MLSFSDLILSNDREILLRADDSVVDMYQNRPYMIRRSRGYAPSAVTIGKKWTGQVLAMGGELKNTFCIGKNQLFYPSAYVGDLTDVHTIEVLQDSIKRMLRLLDTVPSVVACDMQPQYQSVLLAQESGLPVFYVQHHQAHILSCMAEHNYMEPVIGIAFDGTGYGTDGTIWGGEILQVSPHRFTRFGSISSFCQVGGDLAAVEGWRVALSMIDDLFGKKAEEIVDSLGLCEKSVQKLCVQMKRKNINCITSTSAGRLFDAVSAILNICLCSTFEGEAAQKLQFAAMDYESQKSRPELQKEKQLLIEEFGGLLEVQNEEMFRLATGKLVSFIIEKKLTQNYTSAQLAYLFHVILAEQVVAGCKKAVSMTGIKVCALSGGVFQNGMFLRLCEEGLEAEQVKVLRHSLIPTNDGGIALGQAVAAMAYLNRQEGEVCVLD